MKNLCLLFFLTSSIFAYQQDTSAEYDFEAEYQDDISTEASAVDRTQFSGQDLEDQDLRYQQLTDDQFQKEVEQELYDEYSDY